MRGFTLIELLTVIVILAILSVIVIPTVTVSIKEAKEEAYKEQVNIVKQAAENYFTNSNYTLEDNEEKVVYLTDIINSGYIENDNLINPKTDKKMTGCVLINYYSGQYHYNYLSDIDNCNQYTNIKE